MAIQLGSAYGKIVIDSSGVKVGVDGAMKSLGTLGEVANKIGSQMQKIGGAMTLGLTLPIVGFFASSVKSAMEAENALAEVNAVLASTGGIAGVTAEEVEKLATELQKTTKFSDEQIMSGESMLLTFTKIGKDVFPIATEAMLNMAEKFGSVEQASIQLGKALNDPIAGVGALRRIGVALSDQQEQQIKDFMAVNDIASAQKVILKELEVEFGGLAVAAGDTAAGKFAQFNNTLDDFKEVIGTAIIPSLIRFMDALTPILIALSNLPPGVTDSIIAFLALLAVAGPLISVLGTLVKAFAAFAPGGALAGVGTFMTTTLLPAFSTFFTFITATAIPAIVAFAVANAWWIVPLLLVAATVYLVYLAFKNNWMGITTTLQQAAFLIDVAINNAIASIKNYIGGILDALTNIKNGAIKLYEDGSGALHDLAIAFGFPAQAAQEFLQKIYDLVTSGGYAFTLLFEDGSGLLMKLAVAFGVPEQAAQKFLAKVYDVFSKVITTAKQLWAIIQWAFSGIGRAVDFVVAKIDKLKAALLNIKLPPALTPGSPTPFEMGLRGIGSAMDDLSKKGFPNLQASMAYAANSNDMARAMARPMQNNNSSSTSTVMNFSNGLTLRDVDAMINDKINRFARRAMGG